MRNEPFGWSKPWKLTEGFLFGGGLFVVGLVLQWTMGPIDWSLFAAPVGGIVLIMLLGFLLLMYLLRKKVYAFEWMMHGHAAVAAIAVNEGLENAYAPLIEQDIMQILVESL